MRTRAEVIVYLAGFFDGEGCIRTVPNRNYQLVITVAQVNPEPLRLLESTFGGSVTYRTWPIKRGWKPQWLWKSGNQVAGRALREMLPYLIVKREEAEAGLRLADSLDRMITRKGVKRGDRLVPHEVLAERRELSELISSLKRRSFPEPNHPIPH